MEPSTRTPEGEPSRCPVCGKRLQIEPSRPPGDAPCPHCGSLLWFDRDGLPGLNKVLVAEGDESEQQLWRETLADLGCGIQFVAEGENVLERAKRFQPDVLLLNVKLPMLDLGEVCRSLKEGTNTQNTKVLLIGAERDPIATVEQAVAAGIHDFVSEPINKSELRQRIQILLELKQVQNDRLRLRKEFGE